MAASRSRSSETASSFGPTMPQPLIRPFRARPASAIFAAGPDGPTPSIQCLSTADSACWTELLVSARFTLKLLSGPRRHSSHACHRQLSPSLLRGGDRQCGGSEPADRGDSSFLGGRGVGSLLNSMSVSVRYSSNHTEVWRRGHIAIGVSSAQTYRLQSPPPPSERESQSVPVPVPDQIATVLMASTSGPQGQDLRHRSNRPDRQGDVKHGRLSCAPSTSSGL